MAVLISCARCGFYRIIRKSYFLCRGDFPSTNCKHIPFQDSHHNKLSNTSEFEVDAIHYFRRSLSRIFFFRMLQCDEENYLFSVSSFLSVLRKQTTSCAGSGRGLELNLASESAHFSQVLECFFGFTWWIQTLNIFATGYSGRYWDESDLAVATQYDISFKKRYLPFITL